MHRLLLLGALGVAVAGCDSSGVAPPPLDRCDVATGGSVDALEIGGASEADLSGTPPATFTPLAEGDGVPLLRGNQGAYMVGFVLRVRGAAAPECLDQRTVVSDTAGMRITAASIPLKTYARPDGTRMTAALWMPAEYPATFSVTVDAAGQSLTRHLHLNLVK
ncbi:MAG: hypothetical protein JWN44_1376 [Myxococcales bacterium]|nr:hypothetical protein [Myxococcales bacterium]